MQNLSTTLAVVLLVLAAPLLATGKPTPQSVADELAAADKAFAAAGAKSDVVTTISAMLADDASMLAPGGRLATGRKQIEDVLRTNPDNPTSHIDWAPVRVGISADGTHGFTFGFQTITRADGTKTPGKYLAYWVKQPDGWRVVAYKRRPAPGGQTGAPMAAALPKALVPKSAAADDAARAIDAAERAFSDEAQKIGLGPAFVKYGSTDAINLGGPEDKEIVLGPEAIGRLVSQGETRTGGSTVNWAPDKVIAAPGGDLGVTIGMINENEPTADGKPAQHFAFFTVWRRADAQAEWRYVAE